MPGALPVDVGLKQRGLLGRGPRAQLRERATVQGDNQGSMQALAQQLLGRVANSEAGDKTGKLLRFRRQAETGRRAFFDHRGILLRDLVQVRSIPYAIAGVGLLAFGAWRLQVASRLRP